LKDPQCLCLPREALLKRQLEGVEDEKFPRIWRCRGLSLDLEYRFEPGASDDGVSLLIPLATLSQVDERQCDWLVPGLLPEKVLALMKSLPQRQRRNVVPLQAWVDGFVSRYAQLDPKAIAGRSLIDALIDHAREEGSASLSPQDFRLEQLPKHLQMHFRLLDQHGSVIGVSRSLVDLKRRFGPRAQTALQAAFQGLGVVDLHTNAKAEQSTGIDPMDQNRGHRSAVDQGHGDIKLDDLEQRYKKWEIEELPEMMELNQKGQKLIGFPAWVDYGDAVGLKVFDDLDMASATHEAGVMRLLLIHFREPLRFFLKQMPDAQSIEVSYSQWGSAKQLHEDLCCALLKRACLGKEPPRSASSFEALCQLARPRLALIGQELARLLRSVLTEHAQLQKKMPSVRGTPLQSDVEQQLAFLLPKDFLKNTPPAQFTHLPRYLQAISLRLDRHRSDPQRDRDLMQQMAALDSRWRKAWISRRGRKDDVLEQFAWMLQELRVSLFAQNLKTPMPVSVKRLERWWEANAVR